MRRRKSWVKVANSALCKRAAVVVSLLIMPLSSLTANSGSTLTLSGIVDTSFPVAASMETNPLPMSHRWDSPNLVAIVVLSVASVR